LVFQKLLDEMIRADKETPPKEKNRPSV